MKSDWTNLQIRASTLSDPHTFLEGPPWDLFDEMREMAPVLWTPQFDDSAGIPGFWSLTRAEDIAVVSRDWQAFSVAADGPLMDRNQLGGVPAIRQTLLGKDPDAHTRQRSLVSSHFKPSAVRSWETTIQAVAGDRIRELAQRDTFDLMNDLALRVPIEIVSRMLGIPEADREQVFSWAQAVVAFEDPDVRALHGSAADARESAFAYSVRFLAERARCPTNDLASAIAVGAYGDGPAPADEKAALLRQIIEAGADTTANTLVFAILAFAENPDQWRLLRGDRSLLRGAVEEVLRWATPVAYFRRTAMRPTTVGGQEIEAGDPVVMWYAAANRDPEIFEDPYKFDVARVFRPHYTFGGGGPHVCLGSNLARLELRIILDLMLDAFPEPVVPGPVTRIRGMAPMGFLQAIVSCPGR